MRGSPPTPRRIVVSAVAALTLGLGGRQPCIAGFSDSFLLQAIEGLAVFGAGAAVISAARWCWR